MKRDELVEGYLESLIYHMPEISAFQLGAFRLEHHDKRPQAPLSPFYIDFRVLQSYPHLRSAAARILGGLCEGLKFDRMVGVPATAVPIVAVMTFHLHRPMITLRLDKKSHGLAREIDGVFKAGESALLIDDVITEAGSKWTPIKVLERNGLIVRDVVVLIDREMGGREKLEEAGYTLHSAITVSELLNRLFGSKRISPLAFEICMEYQHGGLAKGWEAKMKKGWRSISLPLVG